ncbi:hypothetical protein PAXRUDRAFT_159868 [Paxillus rubicundulus Ve08.2h10]|uniref:Uncharacterized protein n=1 Tax=Paxillus rubicundulus Ve08.2h10 TaxID=930991 RepID=A0A0D0D8G5_9AGAM|nr:hypothetical protein PAXRUDRAFT_159868 [Paxillus rubicundulus Ve08.2h10]
MVRTLHTIERCLGVDTNKLITNYIICPTCWKVYHLSELHALTSTLCTAPFCEDTIFHTKQTTTGGLKQIPKKVMPSSSLKLALAKLLSHPGKWEELQHWRKEGDHEPAPPITQEQWYGQKNIEDPLEDIYDGWMWCSVCAGMIW